jgi:PPOX class probable F420-dependent enzyme
MGTVGQCARHNGRRACSWGAENPAPRSTRQYEETTMTYEIDENLRRRLTEPVIWMTTVTPSGRPAPRPVWFIFDGEVFTVFSSSSAAKVKHIRANPNISLNFNTDPEGGSVLVVSGKATPAEGISPSTTPAYLEKYEARMKGIGHDLASFDKAYDLGIRITPERSWGF